MKKVEVDLTENPKIKEIDPEGYYSASKIIQNKWMWMGSIMTLTAFLRSDEGKRILKPLIIKRGATQRYRVKGSDLIEMLKLMDKGELRITYHAN